jgi:hypothetical protein
MTVLCIVQLNFMANQVTEIEGFAQIKNNSTKKTGFSGCSVIGFS